MLLAYSARNRSASCRIPFSPSPNGKRVEVRFPDPGANPYLAYAAMLMAGLDGIENKIHPGGPMDKDLYALPPEELAKVPQVCGLLREALGQPDQADHEFLKKGGVFSQDFIDSYIELKYGGSVCLRAHAASDRVQDVLLGLIERSSETRKGAGLPAPFCLLDFPPPGAECSAAIKKGPPCAAPPPRRYRGRWRLKVGYS